MDRSRDMAASEVSNADVVDRAKWRRKNKRRLTPRPCGIDRMDERYPSQMTKLEII